MREVVVAGVGQTPFGALDRGVRALGRDAVFVALDDAPGVAAADVDSAFVGNVGGPADPQRGIVGQVCLREAGLTGIPITNVENACSSSSCAVRHAYREVASGFADVALVLGVEKMTGISTEAATGGLASAADVEREASRGLTFPALYGMRSRAYQAAFDHPDERFRRALSAVSVKNHRNALDNEYAHFSKEITVADVLDSPLVADPLRLYDMCPNSDGAAALVLVAGDVVDAPSQRRTRPRVTVEAAVHRTGAYDDPDQSLARASSVSAAATEAYERAGITVDDVDVFEVHDASTLGELQNVEALGICEDGGGVEAVLDGRTERTGPTPVNPSGGLKARGHPVGATGVAQLVELTWQLRDEAGSRQIPDATVGLAENAGGALNGVSANTTIHVLRAR